MAIVLIWIQSPHEDNLSSCERYKIITSPESSGHNACSALLDHGTGTIDLRQLPFDIGCFCAEPTNYEWCLHPSDTFKLHIAVPTITCSLGLCLIHKLKRFVTIYKQLFFLLLFYFVFFLLYFFCRPFTTLWKKEVEEEAFFLQNILFFSNLNFSFKNIIFITYNKMWRASVLSCFPLLF